MKYIKIKIVSSCLLIFFGFISVGIDALSYLWISAIPMIILAVLLVVSKEEVFSLWWKVCIPFFVVSYIAIYFSVFPDTGGGLGWGFGGWAGARVLLGWFFMPILFLLSIFIIALKSYKLRGKVKNKI